MLQRIVIGIMLAAVAVAAFYLGGWFFAGLLTAVLVLCALELLNAFKAKGYRPFYIPALAFAALFALNYELELIKTSYLLLACLLLVCFERVLNKNRTTQDSLASLLPFAYPLPFLVSLRYLLGLGGEGPVGQLAVALLIICCAFADSFAYFFGKAFGKRKLIERLSPKKTIAGGVAGVFGGIFAALGAYFVLGWVNGTIAVASEILALPAWIYLIIGLVCGTVGQIGDLFASAIKRWANIKDFGAILPGHGGMLDRVDSLVMCAPVVLIILNLLFPGC